MYHIKSRKTNREKRRLSIRNKIFGTAVTPRLSVFRSNKDIYAQIIDDQKGITLATASTLEKDLKDLPSRTNIDAAKEVGMRIAQKAQEKGITEVVFDRSGYKYHGCVAALADAAREKGLQF